jgi:hypothetical protein
MSEGGTEVFELGLSDILDLRAYERVRTDFRAQVMARKRVRRVPLGEVATVVFESVDTVRFQVQEMARVEKIISDEGIAAELEIYNKLLPQRGELSVTLFIELTSDDEMRRWLPRLVGIEKALAIELDGGERVPGVPEAEHEASLTRSEVTAAVHYVRFPFTAAQVSLLGSAPASLVAEHPEYQAQTALSDETRQVLVADLEGRTEPIPLG